jgi:hypothetical protein
MRPCSIRRIRRPIASPLLFRQILYGIYYTLSKFRAPSGKQSGESRKRGREGSVAPLSVNLVNHYKRQKAGQSSHRHQYNEKNIMGRLWICVFCEKSRLLSQTYSLTNAVMGDLEHGLLANSTPPTRYSEGYGCGEIVRFSHLDRTAAFSI